MERDFPKGKINTNCLLSHLSHRPKKCFGDKGTLGSHLGVRKEKRDSVILHRKNIKYDVKKIVSVLILQGVADKTTSFKEAGFGPEAINEIKPKWFGGIHLNIVKFSIKQNLNQTNYENI